MRPYHPKLIGYFRLIRHKISTIEILEDLLARRGWGFHRVKPTIGSDIIQFSRLFPRNRGAASREWWPRLWAGQETRMDPKSRLVYGWRIGENGRSFWRLQLHWILDDFQTRRHQIKKKWKKKNRVFWVTKCF